MSKLMKEVLFSGGPWHGEYKWIPASWNEVRVFLPLPDSAENYVYPPPPPKPWYCNVVLYRFSSWQVGSDVPVFEIVRT